MFDRNRLHYICYDISELQDLQGHSKCKKFLPTVPQATKFRISVSSEGTYVGKFSCIEGYHGLGNPNAVCDPTKNGTSIWKYATNREAPKCAVNIAKNKPAYQSGSTETDDLFLAASRGIQCNI